MTVPIDINIIDIIDSVFILIDDPVSSRTSGVGTATVSAIINFEK